MKGRAMKTDPRYLVVTFYQTIHKVWLWKMAVCQNLICEVYSCILFQGAARGSRIFSNMTDILIVIIHVYSTGGLICNWRIRDNE